MKIVITGGPCCGKTTIINLLQSIGYPVVHETAREIIIQKRYSKYLNRHKDEALQLQLDIHQRQLEKEDRISLLKKKVFLDRSHIDIQAYCEHLLGATPRTIKEAKRPHYDLVLFLERLPFEDDGLRREDDAQAERLQSLILKAYRDNGYDPIIIPVMEIEDRMKKILEIVESQKNQIME